MAGLLAARVVADRYERVTLIERDLLPAGGGSRRGVPQGRHAHAVLGSGRQVLEELFPGLTDQLVALGAQTGDVGEDGRWILHGKPACKIHTGLVGLGLSRPLLEGQVRARLLAYPHVRILEGCEVHGLTAGDGARHVSGVRLQRREEGAPEEVLAADLVIDATGRRSRSPVWLKELGYRPPPEERVVVDVTYTTRLYRRYSEDLHGDLAVLVGASPARRRAGVALAIEGERWMVTLAGILGEQAPADEQGFVHFAAGLLASDVYELIRDRKPLSDAVFMRFPANERRRYERLDRFPEGLLVFGDALCSFNPVYGQGMTVAALQAVLLGECLDLQGTDQLARRFFRGASRLINAPWDIAAGSDLAFEEVEGRRGLKVRVLNRYIARLLAVAHQDATVAAAFHRVANLVAPPRSLLHPRVALRVLLHSRGEGRTGTVAHLER